VDGEHTKPFADGLVRGTIDNILLLNERDALLRIATTNMAGSPTNRSSNLYTLDYFLRTYGTLSNIAPGQTLYSGLYTLERLYMITNSTVDSIITISITDPSVPFIMGTLPVPGFSNFLFSYDNATIIMIGSNLNATRATNPTIPPPPPGSPPSSYEVSGLKIGIFDVSNGTMPKSKCQWKL
jgi:uncharacterized secreted protein with C-terminal beta-propeller domain